MLEQEIKDILDKRDISVFECDRERCTPGLKCIDCLAQSIAQLFEAEKAEMIELKQVLEDFYNDYCAGRTNADNLNRVEQALISANKYLGEKK